MFGLRTVLLLMVAGVAACFKVVPIEELPTGVFEIDADAIPEELDTTAMTMEVTCEEMILRYTTRGGDDVEVRYALLEYGVPCSG